MIPVAIQNNSPYIQIDAFIERVAVQREQKMLRNLKVFLFVAKAMINSLLLATL